MSEGRQIGRPFAPGRAPRTGGKPGRRAKLSAQAMQILDRLQADWMKHGAATLRVLRLEQPQAYARLAVEVAAKLTLAESAEAADGPTILVVRWGDPNHPAPSPPERPINSPPSPPPAPQSSPQLLTFRRPLA